MDYASGSERRGSPVAPAQLAGPLRGGHVQPGVAAVSWVIATMAGQ